jgi:hypothetical protein
MPGLHWPTVTRALIICVVVALLAAACGPPGPKTYNEAKSRACVVGEHLRVGPPPASDFIASTALGGAFRVTFRDNNVTVSFGSNPQNAAGLDAGYRAVRAKNVGIDDVLRTQGSVVMLWHAHPSDGELGQIQDCLK